MPQAFKLRVSDSEIADLRHRLARTRFPDSAPGGAFVARRSRRLHLLADASGHA
jgi:hypothetical protein